MRDKLCCVEAYLGSEEDVAQTTAHLREARGLELTSRYLSDHLRRVKKNDSLPSIDTKFLAEIIESKDSSWFDIDHFQRVIDGCSRTIKKTHSSFTLLDPSAYVVGVSNPTGGVGGFYGDYGIGFQYEMNFGFSEILNPQVVGDPKIRALELARNHVHDSFHASTYRSFARYKDTTFRYQYGINFRLPTGESYSGTTLVPGAKYVINLNTLMDGVTVLVTADAIRDFASDLEPANDISATVIDEILGNFSNSGVDKIEAFASQVIFPARDFISYFGGEIRNVLEHAIIAGDVDAARQHINHEANSRLNKEVSDYLENRKSRWPGLPDTAWERLFLSPDFLSGMSKDPLLNDLRPHCRLPSASLLSA